MWFINNQLIKKKEYQKQITNLKTPFNKLQSTSKIKQQLKDSIINSYNESINEKRFGILFSGGVDSTLLALLSKQYKKNFICYTVGFKNSQDMIQAEKIATQYKFKLRKTILTLESFEKLLKQTIKILKSTDIIWISVGAVTLAGIKEAKKSRETTILSGLGSEELFAGYQRHQDALKTGYKTLHNECIKGLKSMYKRDLQRDYTIAKHQNINLVMPYLNKETIKTALQIHPKLKLNKSNNKIILRKIAEELGLKKEFAQRPKKAAQYGSNIIKAIDKLAKQSGFKTKKEYLTYLYKETKENN